MKRKLSREECFSDRLRQCRATLKPMEDSSTVVCSWHNSLGVGGICQACGSKLNYQRSTNCPDCTNKATKEF